MAWDSQSQGRNFHLHLRIRLKGLLNLKAQNAEPSQSKENMLMSLSRLRTQNSLKLLEAHLVIIIKWKTDTEGLDGFATFVVNQVTLDLFVISY